MKLLVIMDALGSGAGGIVNKSLLDGFRSRGVQYKVVCNTSRNCDGHDVISVNRRRSIPERIRKALLILLGWDLGFILFEINALKKANVVLKSFDPDAIFAVCGGGSLHPFSIAARLAFKKRKKLWLHALDPLPSPSGWNEKEYFRRAIIRCIRPYYEMADFVSSTNEVMLNYQLDVLNIKKRNKVIYNPISGDFQRHSRATNPLSFLYLGSFYGARSPEPLLRSFIAFAQANPGAVLTIVGRNNINLDDYGDRTLLSSVILLVPYTTNLTDFLRSHTVLIDVDADIEDDVFISSKLTGYLNVNRVILCLTRSASPSSNLLQSASTSIVLTRHDNESVVRGLEKSARVAEEISDEQIYADRRELLTKLSAESNAQVIINCFS